MPEELPQLRILNDKEINEINEDMLGFQWLAETIKTIIMKTETPITIGVYGDWGSGKTSLMRLARELLQAEATTIWFNAWKFDQVYDLRVALIQTVLKELEKDSSISKQVQDFAKRINWLGVARACTNFILGIPFTNIEDLLKQKETINLIGEFDDKFRDLVNDFSSRFNRPFPRIDLVEILKLSLTTLWTNESKIIFVFTE